MPQTDVDAESPAPYLLVQQVAGRSDHLGHILLERALGTQPFRLVFPDARPARPLSENTHAKLLRELGFHAVTHGFRSSFRDYAAEQTHTPHAAMEAALARIRSRTRRRPPTRVATCSSTAC